MAWAALGPWFNQHKLLVICLRSVPLVWFENEMKASRFTIMSRDASDLARASPGFLPNFVLSFISNFQDGFRGSGKQLHLFCSSFIVQMKTPLNAGKTFFGHAQPLEAMIALRRIRPLCRTMFLNLLFIITLPHFIGFPPPPAQFLFSTMK